MTTIAVLIGTLIAFVVTTITLESRDSEFNEWKNKKLLEEIK